eukprot:SAG11_NODE_996_length_6253_cov_3.652909_1_plen_44_part_10
MDERVAHIVEELAGRSGAEYHNRDDEQRHNSPETAAREKQKTVC